MARRRGGITNSNATQTTRSMGHLVLADIHHQFESKPAPDKSPRRKACTTRRMPSFHSLERMSDSVASAGNMGFCFGTPI
jgi:hypothetical protein